MENAKRKSMCQSLFMVKNFLLEVQETSNLQRLILYLMTKIFLDRLLDVVLFY